MLSNKLTFSLASLVLILAFALVAMPVMAHNPTFAPTSQGPLTWEAGDGVNVTLPEATHEVDTTQETITYTLSPALPNGVTRTGRILTGIPRAGAAEQEYTWTATASSGHSDEIEFMITVASAPMFTSSFSDQTVKAGRNVNFQLPKATDADGGTPIVYSIDPDLPTGLDFDETNVRITGSVSNTVVTALTDNEVDYTLTATGDTETDTTADPNTDTLEFKITYEADRTPTLGAASAITAMVGDEVEVSLPTVPMANINSGEEITYALSPSSVPSGLRHEEIAGIWFIRGTPNAVMAETEYTWTATDPDGESAMVKFKITINAGETTNAAPTFNTGLPTTISGTVQTAITSVTFGATDTDTGDTLTWMWDAAANEAELGLALDTATGTISGTPLKVHDMQHTITVSDGTASATHNITITIVAEGEMPIDPDPPTDFAMYRARDVMAIPTQAMKSITVTWDAPSNTQNLMEYQVEVAWRDSNGAWREIRSTIAKDTTPLAYTFPDLAAETYRILVNSYHGQTIRWHDVRVENITIYPDVTITTTATDLSAPFVVTFTFSEKVMLNALYAADRTAITVTDGRVKDRSIETAHTKPTDEFKVWEATIVPFDTATSVTVTTSATVATDKATEVLTVSGAPTTYVPTDDTPAPTAATLPANGYAVLVHQGATTDDHGIDGSKVALIERPMPNLDEFFDDGGTIVISTTGTAAVGAVKISEIMWGTDASLATTADPSLARMSQWIELYNTTGSAIAFNTTWKVEFTDEYVTPALAIDSISNLGNPGYWDVKGSGGRTIATSGTNAQNEKDLVSMYRKLKQLSDTAHADHGKDDGIPHRAGTWVVSSKPRRNLSGARVGTPGANPSVRVSTATAPTQTVLINEIGNSGNDAYDWVEILNTTAAEINLKKWELNIVMADANGDPAETQLVSFPDNDDTKLPANGILLITNSDPSGSSNDLAAGTQVNKKADDQVKRGVKSLYYPDAALDLPNDNSKYLLILRNANDKEGASTNIIDVGGTYFGEKNDETITTEVWPLQGTAAGHGDVIKDDPPEDFRAGFVYKRAAVNSGIGEHHWEKVGFTGVGYDRAAAKTDENGGTPGYANDSLKEKLADLASDAEVTISEIMFEAGPGRRNLSQWIELYNSSMTQAVNLNEWKLEIQNARDENLDARLNATITFGATTIAPNQTVLIVSTSGLNSGSGHFPNTRVVNLWTDHRDSIEMETRNDTFLSTTGFYMELTDKDNKLVDEVGNTDGNRRTDDAPAWALPMSSEAERRSSILRRYESGIALDGMSEAGWVSASETSLAFAISHTYFGSPDDFGTPGFRGGGPLPVNLSSFRPARDTATGAVVIRWATESELDNAGFNILRSETKTGEFKVVNLKGIIPGQGTTSEKHTYEWKDTSAKPNVVYYYQIEDVSLDGKRTTLRTTHLRGNVNAAGKATTRWGELKDSRY